MLKKFICFVFVLLICTAIPASASSFDDMAETVIDYVTQCLETEGIPNRYTQRDPNLDLELAALLEFDYYSCFNEEEDSCLTVQGHDNAMEIFEAATADVGSYEEIVLASLYLVQGVYGVCPDEVIEWAGNTIPSIIESAKTEIAYLYSLDGNAFFFMHRMPGSSALEPTVYYASVYFPCLENCPMTEIVSYMKSLATETKPSPGADCDVCEGVGVVISNFEQCDLCFGAQRIGTCTICHGKTVCKICEGKGYVEMYNYVWDYPVYKDCTACDLTGICPGCDGTGMRICTRCGGNGYRSTTSKCTACDGDGRK